MSHRACTWFAGLTALSALAAVGSAWAQADRPLPENHGKVEARLFLGDGDNEPLIVGFGGAEGGNFFASELVRPAVDGFLKQGYAFLAVGYFGAPGTPSEVDRIALEGVHAAIMDAARNPKVNGRCIAVIGGSKGAELALLLASHYPDIKAVVALVPGSSIFPAHTSTMDTPSFSLNGEPFPFVPVPESAAPALRRRDLRAAFEEMRKDRAAVERAAIPVERINGPILLISATRDEMWPSTEMSEEVVQRLEKNNFPYAVQHIAINGRHNGGYSNPQATEEFLRTNLLSQNEEGCPRNRD